MPVFGSQSRKKLSQLHPDLQLVARESIKIVDFSIIEGHRDKQTQNRYFNARPQRSKVQWPDGKQNKIPSEAMDSPAYVNGAISWNKSHNIYVAGVIMATAYRFGVRIRWGGNWDSDGEVVTDQSFQDLAHYELIL